MIRRFILFGLLGIIWFGALFQAAYDLWASVLVFAALGLLLALFARLFFWLLGLPQRVLLCRSVQCAP